ncbi:hypothetical protein C5167_005104 [Papaver somniferum]|uniref:Uncharacterized protein n=1 Tax=Papaver somniferum TaxID=3469 RepID=A0A4Y7JD22_PAPSO|nr:hypothetical protein C5167_005104 [Papaver somniferum]
MAVQASMGISRILFMLGTGCTGTILVQKGQLSQILGSLQSYVKRLDGGSDDTDLVSQDKQSAGIAFLCNTAQQQLEPAKPLQQHGQQLETAKPLQAIEYKPQRKFIVKSTTNGLLTIMDSPKEPIMDSPKEPDEQDSKVKPSISSAFSRKATYMGISLVI